MEKPENVKVGDLMHTHTFTSLPEAVQNEILELMTESSMTSETRA